MPKRRQIRNRPSSKPNCTACGTRTPRKAVRLARKREVVNVRSGPQSVAEFRQTGSGQFVPLDEFQRSPIEDVYRSAPLVVIISISILAGWNPGDVVSIAAVLTPVFVLQRRSRRRP